MRKILAKGQAKAPAARTRPDSVAPHQGKRFDISAEILTMPSMHVIS
jgi:hypothetical protein